MSHPRTLLGTLSRYLWYSFVVLVVTAAVMLSVARLLLPEARTYRESVERWASNYLGQPVHITAMDASLEGLTPTVTFKGVRLMDVADKRAIIHFRELRLGIALLASLREGQLVPSNLTVVGADLAVTREKTGEIRIRGIRMEHLANTANGTAGGSAAGAHAATGTDAKADARPDTKTDTGTKSAAVTPDEVGSNQLSRWLFQRDVLALRDSQVQWRDLRHNEKPVLFRDVNVWLRNRNGHHRLTGYVSLPEPLGKRLQLAVDMRGNVLEPDSLTGQFYVLGERLHPERIGLPLHLRDLTMHAAELDVELWGSWQGLHLTGVSGTIDARHIALSLSSATDRTAGKAARPLSLSRAGAHLHWVRDAGGWRLNMDRVRLGFGDHDWPAFQLQAERVATAGLEHGSRFTLSSTYLRLDDLAHTLLASPLLDKSLRDDIKVLAPQGEIHGVRAQWEVPAPDKQAKADSTPAPPHYQLQARFSDLSVKALRHFPGLDDVAGTLWMDNTQGELRIASRRSTLDMPRLFRQPLQLERLDAAVSWQRREGIWYVRSHDFQLASPDLQASGDLLLEVAPATSPYMELLVHFDQGDAARVSRYLPAHIMAGDTVKWLDQAFISGQVRQGGMVFNGRLADFPFRHEQGQFLVQFKAKDLVMRYKPGWPRLTGVEADASFTGLGMDIRLARGKLYDSDVVSARVGIREFARPLLSVTGTVKGGTADVVRFLADSPIAHSARETLDTMQVSGRSQTDVSLRIPLTARVARRHPLHVAGKVRFNDSRLQLFDKGLDIAHINGDLHFTEHTQEANDIRAVMFGADTLINVYSPRGKGPGQTVITARGGFSPAAVEKNPVLRHSPVQPWLRFLHGTTAWQAALTLDYDKRAVPVRLRVTSALEGLAVTLPAPAGKAAHIARPLSVDVSFAPGRPSLHVALAGTGAAALALRRSGGQWRLARAGVTFGSSEAKLPKRPVIMLSGSLHGVEPAAWAGVFRQLEQGRHGVGGLSRPELPIVLNMDSLYLLQSPPQKVAAKAVSEPPQPRRVPLVNGEIRDLRYDRMALGRLRLATAYDKHGLVLNRVSLNGAHGQIDGQARWSVVGGAQRTEFRGQLKSSNFGAYLSELDFASVMDGGKADASLDVHWPASPFAFSMAQLGGRITLHVTDGSITDVNPGAGRLFGLLSLNALPRRLLFDFGDVFKKGLSFDSIKGSFNIADGNATTNDLELKSPAANIRVQGRTGLAAHDYNQLVTVIPQVSDTLPLAGGLAWGAQAGAIILLFQKLFKPEIDKAAQYQYRITGSWEHPTISRLEAKQADKSGKEQDKSTTPTRPLPGRGH